MRGHLDAAEYKHVVLGLIFLKYISDAFSELYDIYSEQPHIDPEDRDEYTAENVFWVPKEARWSFLHPERRITYGIVKVGDFVAGGVPVIRGGDIRNNRIIFDDQKCVTEEVSNQFRRTILKGGELLINLIAEPGHVAIVPRDLAGSNVSRDVAVIALNNSVDHRFVCYFLKSPYCVQWLSSRLQGSVTQKINLNTLREVPVPFPPLLEQKAIAQILSSLDDKIELNREMNKTLEAIA